MRIQPIKKSHFAVLVSSALVILALGQGHSSADELPQDRQDTQVVLADIGITLDPIPAAYDPSIEAQVAADTAETENLPMDPAEVDGEMIAAAPTPTDPPIADFATLVLFTDTEFMAGGDLENESEAGASLVYDAVPAWVVTFTDVCVPAIGLEDSGECAGNTLNVVVDSESGEYLEAYSYE